MTHEQRLAHLGQRVGAVEEIEDHTELGVDGEGLREPERIAHDEEGLPAALMRVTIDFAELGPVHDTSGRWSGSSAAAGGSGGSGGSACLRSQAHPISPPRTRRRSESCGTARLRVGTRSGNG